MGKSTISMAIFNSYFDITRGYLCDISRRRQLAIQLHIDALEIQGEADPYDYRHNKPLKWHIR